MPKKTKSQKIIAELRRKLAAQPPSIITPQPIPQKISKKKKRESPLSSTKIELKTPKSPSSFIVNDLKKSLLLTGLAISLELVLYYFWK